MDNNREKNRNNINNILTKVGSNFNILEEEVDMKVQKEYFSLIKSLTTNTDEYQEICKKYIEEINELFTQNISDDVKKSMLTILATIDDITIYRAIENFSKQDTPLKKWATISLQQSRMLIQSTLLDDPGVFISTGLGGQGTLLRYFCVFLNRKEIPLEGFQQKILKDETEAVITKEHGLIEQIDFLNKYTTMSILLPLNVDLEELFINLIDECNEYGNFLDKSMIVTNVKKLSDKEIRDILTKKK